ncbi:ATP6V0B [Cordylochernes scorpioides]|uniref:ATP6V0B n=1 Tax=Cordylochernes scorpioides TaxID=51811 RepID=A0ABY6KJ84_9ARAC|nr:ATP6V0B [Cordylochernes scorpioides]
MVKIMKVFPGTDMVRRPVEVKTKSGVLKRAVQQMFPLEVPSEDVEQDNGGHKPAEDEIVREKIPSGIRSKRYLNINIHSRAKVWNLGLTRISGVFSSEQGKYVIGAKLLELGIDFETDILCYAHGLHLVVMDELYAKKKYKVVPEFVSATVNQAESDLSDDDNEDTSPFNVSLEVAHPSFPEAIYPQSPVFSKKNIYGVTKKARVVVKLFKRSPLKNEILLNYIRQDNRISTSMCLILDCRTRWDSLLNMLERLLSVKSAIQKALIDVNANVHLTDEDVDIMTQFHLKDKNLTFVEFQCHFKLVCLVSAESSTSPKIQQSSFEALEINSSSQKEDE